MVASIDALQRSICLLCSERTDLHIAVLVILYTTRASLFKRNVSKPVSKLWYPRGIKSMGLITR